MLGTCNSMTTPEYKIDVSYYESAIKEDELGRVIRTHLHIEYLVDQLLGLRNWRTSL